MKLVANKIKIDLHKNVSKRQNIGQHYSNLFDN